jgi:hypothetical protein
MRRPTPPTRCLCHDLRPQPAGDRQQFSPPLINLPTPSPILHLLPITNVSSRLNPLKLSVDRPSGVGGDFRQDVLPRPERVVERLVADGLGVQEPHFVVEQERRLPA